MGRVPCCDKDNVKRGQWTPEEDNKLTSYIVQYGTRNWRLIPKHSGLQRCGKSCRLRWTNYLQPDLKHGQFSEAEEQTIVTLHSVLGNRWSAIAGQLPGRTDNDVKNHWNTKLRKKLSGMGIDPVTHKPFSQLITGIAATLSAPQVPHLAEAALGCFKDEMLHLLTKKRIGLQIHQFGLVLPVNTNGTHVKNEKDKDYETVEKIKNGISMAIKETDDQTLPINKPWNQNECLNFDGSCSSGFNYQYPWNQNMCAGSSTAGGKLEHEEINNDLLGEKEMRESSNIFDQGCDLWDLPSEDLMNPMV